MRTLRLEQLALFELEEAPAAAELTVEPVLESVPTFYWEPLPEEQPDLVPETAEASARRTRRRRRTAWLPRLVRWVKSRRMTRTGVPRPSPLKLEETPAREPA